MITEIFKNKCRCYVTVVIAAFAVTAFPGLHATEIGNRNFVLVNCMNNVVVAVDESAKVCGINMGEGCAAAFAKLNRIDATCTVSACSAVGPGCWSASCDLKADVTGPRILE